MQLFPGRSAVKRSAMSGCVAVQPERSVLVAALIGSAAMSACSGTGTKPDVPADGFDRRAMLQHVSANVLLPIQATFDAKAAVLPEAIEAHCNALDQGDANGKRAGVVTAWGEAIDAWQFADAVLIGPAAMNTKDLRAKIYAWPLVAPCGLDRDTASRWANPASYEVAKQPPNERSLAAIEYLLFNTDFSHTCPMEPAGWSTLGPDVPRARCRHALDLARDVAARGAELYTAWRADGGNYVGELALAGDRASSIPTAQEAVNRVSDGLFFVDRVVKDMKLAEAAGIAANVCNAVQTPCLQEVELRYSDRLSYAIRANLRALHQAFTGKTASGDGPSFDDFLRAVGQPELADRMTANLDAAIEKSDALPASFLTALQTNYPAIVATHAAVTAFTNDLKSQFLTVLALDIPDDVAADND